MAFYLIIYILIIYFLFSQSSVRPIKSKYRLCIFASIGMILLSGLRNETIGSDTYNYLMFFERSASTSWSSIFNTFIYNYMNPDSGTMDVGKDPGFLVFEKFLSSISTNHQFYLTVIAAFLVFSLSKFIYKFSPDLISAAFALIYYLTFYWDYLPNSSIRQALALALIIPCYKLVSHKKIIWCFVLIILASTLHKSALFFLLFILIWKLGFVKSFFEFAIIPFIALVYIGSTLGQYFVLFSEDYASYGYSTMYDTIQRPYMFLIFETLVYILIFVPLILGKENEFEKYRIFYLGSALALLLSPTVLVDPAVLRIVAYFAVCNCILIPHSIKLYGLSLRRMIFIVLIGLFIFQTYLSAENYGFYWQKIEIKSK
ncbi:MAG: EpsG family protein [Bacteroidales bacterium]|nr:EpsG family protein [Bacteroidales bacterium]